MAAVHALGQLIEDVKASHSPPLSNGDLARRAGLSRNHVHQLISTEMKAMPSPDTLRALAKGLQVPLRIVVEKALDSLGLPSGGGGSLNPADTVGQMRRIVENSVLMSQEDRDYWNAMIDALERRQREPRREDGLGTVK